MDGTAMYSNVCCFNQSCEPNIGYVRACEPPTNHVCRMEWCLVLGPTFTPVSVHQRAACAPSAVCPTWRVQRVPTWWRFGTSHIEESNDLETRTFELR